MQKFDDVCNKTEKSEKKKPAKSTNSLLPQNAHFIQL